MPHLVRRKQLFGPPVRVTFNWRRSKNGNTYARLLDGSVVTVFPSVLEPGRYGWCVFRNGGPPRYSKGTWGTEELAQDAAYAAVMRGPGECLNLLKGLNLFAG